jgi:ABC-2 type transport system permease protein
MVAGRELRERLRAKSFYLLTGLLVAGILVGGVIARVARDDGPSTVEVGVVGGPPELVRSIEAAGDETGVAIRARSLDDDTAGRRALDDGDLDVVLRADREDLLFDGEVDERTAAVVQLAWSSTSLRDALREAGVDPASVLDRAPLSVRSVNVAEEDEVDGLAVLTGSVTAVLLFVSLQTFGGYVLMGVVEEKASAVVEVLLVRIRPIDLLAGKVIGIGGAALLQFAAAVAAGVAALLISGADLPADVLRAVPISLVWFLGGYALYSTLFALAGSLVSRQEDAQAANAPAMTLLVLAYMTIFFFGYVPKSGAARVLSVIPFFAPFEMPMRMAAGAASVVEIVAALVLMVAAVAGVAVLASRIYAQVLLQRGTRITWMAALRTLRR